MRTMKKRILGVFVLAVVLIFAMTFTACEGPEGPMGPQGPAGGVDPNCQHLWSTTTWAETTAPTETTDGVLSRKCIDCSHLVESVTVPALNKFYGTWKENNPIDSLTISKTEIIYTLLSDNKKSTYEILSWTPITRVGDYPAGYTIARKLTALENGATGTIGNESTLTLYMHTTNTSSFQWNSGSSNYTYFKVTE